MGGGGGKAEGAVVLYFVGVGGSSWLNDSQALPARPSQAENLLVLLTQLLTSQRTASSHYKEHYANFVDVTDFSLF